MNDNQQPPETSPAYTEPPGSGAASGSEVGRKVLGVLLQMFGFFALMAMWHDAHTNNMVEAPPALVMGVFFYYLGSCVLRGTFSSFKSPKLAYTALLFIFVAAVDLSGHVGESIWGNAPFTWKEWSSTVFSVSLAILFLGIWLRNEALQVNPNMPRIDFSKVFAGCLVAMGLYALYMTWDASSTKHASAAVHNALDAAFLIVVGTIMLKGKFRGLPSTWQFYPALVCLWFACADATDIAETSLWGNAPLNSTRAWLLLMLLSSVGLFLAYAFKGLATNRPQPTN